MKEKYTILNGDSTLIRGDYIRYFEEGQVAMKGTFANGKPEGEFIEFYETGDTLSKTNYKDGQKTGQFQVRSKSGSLIQKGEWFLKTINCTEL